MPDLIAQIVVQSRLLAALLKGHLVGVKIDALRVALWVL
jgi:hypothetical protein